MDFYHRVGEMGNFIMEGSVAYFLGGKGQQRSILS